MAISQRSVGAWAASNATTQTVTLPTHQAGDMIVVRTIRKPFTSPDSTTIGTAGWAPVAAGRANGATANGNGTGSMGFKAFYKVATSSSETNPVVTWGVTSAPGAAVAVVYQKGAAESWVTPVGDGGGDATARTSQTSTIASHVSVTSGDLVDFFRGAADDSGALTVPTITQTGVTYGAVTEYPATAMLDATSNDIAADGGYRIATAGTSSAAAVVTGTSASSEEHGAWMTRLRVQALEVKTGTVTATGGGVAVSTGQKKGATTATATGGGSAVTTATKAGRGAVVATGAGVAATTSASVHRGTVAGSGGGTATVQSVRLSVATVTASAGGVAATTGQKRGLASVTASASGEAFLTGVTGRSSSVSASAGGSAALTQATSRSASVSATAGGSADADGVAARVGSLTATGGGSALTTQSSARSVAVGATGGGTATIEYLADFGGVGSAITATGGGTVTVSGIAARTGSPTATGAGTATVGGWSARLGVAAATGGGRAVVLFDTDQEDLLNEIGEIANAPADQIAAWFLDNRPGTPDDVMLLASAAADAYDQDRRYARRLAEASRILSETYDETEHGEIAAQVEVAPPRRLGGQRRAYR